MKVFKPVVILFITFLIYSCSSDDSTTPTVNVESQMLVGTWNLTAITQEGTASTPGVPVKGAITSFGKDITAQITFTESPANFTSSGGYTDVISVSIVSLSFTEEVPISIDNVLNQGTWSVNNGELTLAQIDLAQTARVTESTGTSLKIEVDIEGTTTLQGIPVSADTTVKMSFTK